jgi:hypothetical protein
LKGQVNRQDQRPDDDGSDHQHRRGDQDIAEKMLPAGTRKVKELAPPRLNGIGHDGLLRML